MLTALRHPASACQQRRLSGPGQPLTDAPFKARQNARRSTSKLVCQELTEDRHPPVGSTRCCPLAAWMAASAPAGGGPPSADLGQASACRGGRMLRRLYRLPGRMPGAAPANCVCQEKIARCDVFREVSTTAPARSGRPQAGRSRCRCRDRRFLPAECSGPSP